MTRASPGRRRRRLIRRAAIAGAAVGLAVAVARADVQAIDVGAVGTYPPLTANGFNYFQYPGNYTFTWDFTANAPIVVTQLGYYNSALAGTPEPDGFGSHLVTLTDLSTETRLATATVTVESAPAGVFNYASVTPVTLNTKDTYQISGNMTDQYYLVGLNNSAAPTAPQISYQYTEGNIFGGSPPAGTYADFGPNFQFQVASTCTENVSGRNIIALSGDKCTASAGAYNPTTSSVVLPVAYNGFGFYAHGGSIDSPGAVTIATHDPELTGGRIAIWADGAGSLVTLEGATAIMTAGKGSLGVYALGGGQVTSTGMLSVATAGVGAVALSASGSGSRIDATLGAIKTTAADTPALQADGGATLTVTGGTVTTSGVGAVGLSADGVGSKLNASGVQVTTTGGLDKNGGAALGIFAGDGAAVSLANSAVTTSGEGAHALYVTGAGSTASLSGSNKFTTTGAGAVGLLASSGGVVTATGAVTISTAGTNAASSGLSAFGVNADGRNSAITLGAATITTSGQGAVGVFASDRAATGAGGSVTVNGPLTVTTQATLSYDVFASGNGSKVTLNGSSTLNVGAGSFAVYARGGGAVTSAAGLTINATGAGFGGGVEADSGSSVTLKGASVINLKATDLVGLFSTGTGAIASQSALTINAGANSGAVAQGGAIKFGGLTSISSAGAYGVAATGGGSVVASQRLNVSMTGDKATGLAANAASIKVGAGSVVTKGAASSGVAAQQSAKITLSGVAVATSGAASGGVVALGGSQILLTGGSVVTSGSGAIALQASGAGSSITGAPLQGVGLAVTTSGDNATGAQADSGGVVNLTGGSVKTSGAGALGLFASGEHSVVSATDVVVATKGGDFANAVNANQGGSVVMNGGSATSGGADLYTVAVASNASAKLLGTTITAGGAGAGGVDVNGATAVFTGSGLTINANGGYDAESGVRPIGIDNQGFGENAGGGTVNLTDSAITVVGDSGAGLYNADKGTATLTGGSISTRGVGSDGVIALGGSATALSKLTITATGAGANGVNLQGVGSTLTGSALAITTTGAATEAFYNGAATATLTAVACSASGDQAAGVVTQNGGATTISGGSIATDGVRTDAIYGDGGSTTTVVNVRLTASGNAAKGVDIEGAGTKFTGSGLTIATEGTVDAASGLHAQGVYNGSSDPASAGRTGGGVVVLNASTVTASGVGSYGVDTANGGSTALNGGSIAASGQGAIALLASDGASVAVGTDIAGHLANISATGSSAVAVSASSGATVGLNGAVVSAMGDGSSGLVVTGGAKLTATGATVAVSGGVDAASGRAAYGVYNGPASAGGTVSLVNVRVTASGDFGSGVVTGAGGVTTLQGGAVSSIGANASGLVSSEGGQTTLLGVAVSAAGAGAVSLQAIGGGALVTTGLAGEVGVSVSATGASAIGVQASEGGGAALNGGSVTTSGTGAVGLYATGANSSIVAEGVAVQGGLNVLADQGGAVALTGGSVSSNLNGGVAVLVQSGSTANLSSVTVTQAGVASEALWTNGGTIKADALTIKVDSALDPSTNNFGGGVVNLGGAVGLSHSQVTTTGASNFGVYVGAGGATTLSQDTLTTLDGVGIIARDAGSTLTATHVDISAGGDQQAGLTVFGGATASWSGGTVLTTGAVSAAVAAYGGASLTMSGASLSTRGDGAIGLLVADAQTEVQLSDTSVSTKGGAGAFAIYNGPAPDGASGGRLTLSNVTATTLGDGATALATGAGGVTTASGGAYSTSGANAAAVDVADGGSLTVSGAKLTTTGAGAYGAAATGAGGLTLGEGLQITTSGAGAHGVFVSGAGSAALLDGVAGISVSGANAAGVYVENGGGVGVRTALAIQAVENGVVVDGSTSEEPTPTTFAAAKALSITTTGGSGAAVTLSGGLANFAAGGGGTIDAAGTAIALRDGAGLTATFIGYNIKSAGDLVFADPAAGAVNFANTVADAGSGNLLNVTDGSNVALNAYGSTLTGVARTDAGSLSNVVLMNGSSWTITGNSAVTTLGVSNSTVAFAAPESSAFKTLTVNSYIGDHATLALNASLGSLNPSADKLVIDGGVARGLTFISINNVATGPSAARLQGAASATTLAVPIVTTTNGGTIAPGAFQLSGPVTVGGYVYSLQSLNDGEYLVSNPGLTNTQATSSLSTLASAKQTQAITGRVLGSILTGATEQINCSACSSGFASFGSFALGVHGRWTLSPSLALLAGGSYDSYSSRGVSVNNSLLVALALRYDLVQLGRYRPFFEAGVAASPYANITYRRAYTSSQGDATSVGDALSRSVAVYGRAGYIWRLSPRDEAAAYTDLTRSWQSTGGYIEGATGSNPFGATVLPALDTMNVWKIGAQYTHLFGQHIEANVSAGFAEAFGANYGSAADITGFGSASAVAPSSFNWVELGGRLSYRFSKSVVADAFALGTLGAEPAGKQIHGGLALRMAF
jgi:hypothetical protein